MMQTISVVVPVFNGARFLRDAVKNIRCETHAATEIIVIDDGSTDETAQIATQIAATDSNVRFASQENAGPAAARNRGLKLAIGKFIAFLDVDDEWPKNSMKLRMDALQQNPQTQIALGRVSYFRETENRVLEPANDNAMRDSETRDSETRDSETANDDTKRNSKMRDSEMRGEMSEPLVAFNLGAALYRREVFDVVGDFDETLRFGEDTDWFLRAREKAVKLQLLPDVTLHYRLHENGMTHGKNASQLNVARALKLSLDRRRQNSTSSEEPQNLPPLQS